MASASFINVIINLVNGQVKHILLPTSFTLDDFKKAVKDVVGDIDSVKFIAKGRILDLKDEVRFNAQKALITDRIRIQCVQRMMGGCFLKDTSILLSDGTRKIISEIQVGDSLLAFNVLGEIVTTSVQELFVHDVNEYIELNAGKVLLCVTREHPFFIGNGSFCALEKLHTSDCIYNLIDGRLESIPIMNMKTVVSPATRVYNLRTAEPHTYFANGFAVHNKFGADFVDLANTSGLKRHEWSTTAPLWRWAHRGLCLEGKCTNASCEAYQRTVIINIGFKQFDLLADATAATSQCPACRRYVEPKTCAFNNCKWRWWGIKQPESGMPPEEISADWKVADNAYHRFDQDVSGTVVWRKLIIETIKN